MPLLKDGKLVDYLWQFVEDNSDLPENGDIVVSLNRWFEDNDELGGRDGLVGVKLNSDQSPAQLVDALDRIALIAVDFPAFTDGRSYSSARLLRERYGYQGQIRATGEVLLDQYGFMLRCGIDEVQISDIDDASEWLSAASKMSRHYQPAADGVSAIWAKRHAAA